MAFGYVLDPIFAEHQAPHAHPECPERIKAVREAFAEHSFDRRGEQMPVREAEEAELGRVHAAEYLALLERALPGNAGWLDQDTFFSVGSWSAILAAAAAAIDLSSAVLDDRFRRGVALVRPPGHHAEADRAMGFCVVNNVAVAAAMARDAGARVSILDWDVHHGNGTQHIFEQDPKVQYISLHQYPHYPGTGAATEVGLGRGLGATVNLAMPAGCGDADYLAAFDLVVAPEVRGFAPDLILLSAGFDAFEDDPLAGMQVTVEGFRALSRRLVRLSEQVCAGRIVAVLEGGYDLSGLGHSVAALIGEMADMDEKSDREMPPREEMAREDKGKHSEPVSPLLPGAAAAIAATQSALQSARAA